MEYRGGILVANSDLYHHGILGQKWGKRNGPPYPLNASAHSSAENKAGWKKSLKSSGGSGEINGSRFKKRNRKQQKVYDANVRYLESQKKLSNNNLNIEKKKRGIQTDDNRSIEDIRKENIKLINDSHESQNILNKYKKIELNENDVNSLNDLKSLYESNKKKNNKEFDYFEKNDAKIALERAKKEDKYDIEFLEALQNKRILDDDSQENRKKLLKEYESYLKDPIDYLKNQVNDLEDASGSLFSKKKKKNPDAKAIAQERLKTLQKENPALYDVKKQTALQKGNSTEVLQFKGNLTNQQLQDAVNRIRLEKQLSDWSAADVKSNWDKVDDAMKRVKQVTDWTNTTLNAYDAAEKVYKKLSDTK
jgi:hypothetical protein